MQTKLFLGTRLTPDLKMHLHREPEGLQKIPYEGKEYLGFYLPYLHPTVEEIRQCCAQFTQQIQSLFPHMRADALPVVIFPQIFLG